MVQALRNNEKKKVGIAHPRLGRGGSEARAMWVMQALKDDYEVSLITTGEVDLEGLNKYYGTSLRPHEFHIRQAPLPGFLCNISGAAALRGAFYQRYCLKIAHEFDVLVSAYNIVDFGVPAIQCIADFSWSEDIRKDLHPIPLGTRGKFHSNALLRRVYLSVVGSIAKPRQRNPFAGKDLILANSKWTAGIIMAKYGKELGVLYPPVVDWVSDPSIKDRENGFVCIGRIAPEKRIERIIEILGLVKTRGHDIHLHIIGSVDDSSYARFIEDVCSKERDWIKFEGLCVGMGKMALIRQHRFGIHGCQGEAFGIAVAEMVKAGCITFVPEKGGQAEIVDHPSLAYDSVEDAVTKIDSILRDEAKQAELRSHLASRSKMFSSEIFVKQIRVIVEDFLRARH